MYVLEDNFDGTFDSQFEIKIDDIMSIETYKEEYVRGDRHFHSQTAGGLNTLLTFVIEAAILFGSGFIMISKKNSRKPKTYLSIKYKTSDGDIKNIFFSEVSGSIKKLSKTLEKLK